MTSAAWSPLIFFCNSSTDSHTSYWFSIMKFNNNNSLSIGMRHAATYYDIRDAAIGTFDNIWHNLIVVIQPNPPSGEPKWDIYVDGEIDKSQHIYTNISTNNMKQFYNSTYDFSYIGKYPGYTNRNLNGYIHDLRIYNKVLDYNEINALANNKIKNQIQINKNLNNFNITNNIYYTSQNTNLFQYTVLNNSNLVLWYKFDSNQELIDSIGNYNLTNNGSVTFIDNNHIIGKSAYFPNNDYNGFLNITGNFNPYFIWKNNGITFSFWYNLNYSGTDDYGRIFEFGFDTNDRGTIQTRPMTNAIGLYWKTIQSNGPSIIVGNNTMDNTWHHFIWSIDINGNWICWIDGINQNINANYPIPDITYSKNRIGKSIYHDTNLQDLNGYLNDFRIYNKVLNDTEINALANNKIKQTINTNFNSDNNIITYSFTNLSTYSLFNKFINDNGFYVYYSTGFYRYSGEEAFVPDIDQGTSIIQPSPTQAWIRKILPNYYGTIEIKYGADDKWGYTVIKLNNIEVHRTKSNNDIWKGNFKPNQELELFDEASGVLVIYYIKIYKNYNIVKPNIKLFKDINLFGQYQINNQNYILNYNNNIINTNIFNIQYKAETITNLMGWKLVRYTPNGSTIGFSTANDGLKGDISYGILYDFNYQWSIKFHDFDQFLFVRADFEIWLVATKDSIGHYTLPSVTDTFTNGSYPYNTYRNVIISSKNYLPHTVQFANDFNNSGGGRPLISLEGWNINDNDLYSEHTVSTLQNKPYYVFIRNSKIDNNYIINSVDTQINFKYNQNIINHYTPILNNNLQFYNFITNQTNNVNNYNIDTNIDTNINTDNYHL
jgi:hypothetical protein